MITLGELKIYPKLYAAAVENARKDSSVYARERTLEERINGRLSIGYCFSWACTPQDHDFWDAVDDRSFDTAKSLHPELFEEEAATLSQMITREALCYKPKKVDPVIVDCASPQYDSIQIGCKKPKEPEPEPISYLRNDKEREEAKEVSDKIFRKRYT